MNIPHITQLTALAATLAGKKIRLNGTTLEIHNMGVTHKNDKPRLIIETSLETREPCTDSTCDCPICTMSRAIPKQHAADVIALLCQGGNDSLILDSSYLGDDGFHVKIHNVHTATSHVGHGGNIAIAIGRAVTAAHAS